VTDKTTYRAGPDDARHGGLVIVSGGPVTLGLERVCDAFGQDGYETAAVTVDDDVDAVLESLGAPRLLIGFGRGADRAWATAAKQGGVAAMALFHPEALQPQAAPCPTILHLTRAEAARWPDEQPVFGYAAAPGFYLDDDPAHDADAARLARLRTLALFRRTVGRGEA
jgi:hypothetical protein